MEGIFSIVLKFFENSEHFYYLIVYFITLFFSFPIESLLVPFLTGKLINQLYELTPSNRDSHIFKIGLLFVAIIVAWIVNAIAYSVMDSNDSLLISEFTAFFRNFVIEKLYVKYENQFDEVNIGAINTKLIVLPHNLTEFLNIFMGYVFPKVFIVFFIMVYFFYLNYSIGLILLVGLILFYIFSKQTLSNCIDLFVEQNTQFEEINEIQKDKISNLFSIYSSNKMDDEIRDNEKNNENYKESYRSSLRCTNRLKTITYISNLFLFFFIICFTLYLFIHQRLSIGVVVSIFLTVIYLLQYLMDLSYWIPKLVEYYGSVENSNEFIRELDSIVPDSKPSLNVENGFIQFIHVQFRYGDKMIFNDLNLTIESCKKVCIIGKSGSGKSTIVKLLMSYYPVSSGMILIDGQNINDFNVNSIRKNISYIHQSIVLFNKSVYDNIVYGVSSSGSVPTYDQVQAFIVSMNLQNVFGGLKDGLNTQVGVNGDKLSGGQKQIVFILREILSDKKIIVLDEPTSALDPENKKIVLDFIRNIKNKTIIVITHDYSFLDYVDQSYLLKDGILNPLSPMAGQGFGFF
jgi:ABC-type multidrug transport system fused ATPase/permease subunit